jgi:hypothetical protein
VDGISVAITGSYTFSSIVANHNIAIKSGIINYTITASADAHSTIYPSGVIQVSYGNSQTFTYSANSGYLLSNVLVDGTPVTKSGSYLSLMFRPWNHS